MFALAAATRKEWDSRWKTEAVALALMIEMDDVRHTGSRKLSQDHDGAPSSASASPKSSR
jgi:hypothetical protein